MAAYGLNEFVTELQGDVATRRAELDVLKQSIRVATANNELALVAALRRAFVLLAYAHAEGGVRIALAAYVRLINDREMAVGDCNPYIVASAWGKVFRDLADTTARPARSFRNDPGDDPKLHVFTRRAGFVSQTRELEELLVRLPDEVVSTQSNIDQVVLSKLLIQVGLPRDWGWDKAFSDLIFLKELRNRIAHGEIMPVKEEQCEKCEVAALDTLSKLRAYLERSIADQSFLRKAPPDP